MYSYNSAGRVTMQDVRLSSTSGAPADLIATYTWDNMGRMTGLNYPLNGPEVAMSYDAMSRLIGETQTCQGANCQNPGTPEPLPGKPPAPRSAAEQSARPVPARPVSSQGVGLDSAAVFPVTRAGCGWCAPWCCSPHPPVCCS